MRKQQRSDVATKRRRESHVYGLTLVELLVVAVLVGLVAAGAAVSVAGSTDRARLRAATVELEQTLRQARHRARSHRQSVWLGLECGSARYRMMLDGKEGSPWRSLHGVRVVAGGVRGEEPSRLDEKLTIRITPAGASLPFALGMQTEHARRVVWTDGVTGRMHHVDGVGLDEFSWPARVTESDR